MGDAWDEIVAKSGLAPQKPAYGAANGHPKPASTFTANLSNPRVAGALNAALGSAKANIADRSLGRNNQLNAEAANLYSLAVGNNLMSETDLHDWLYATACEAGLHVDDNCGPKGIEDTIASGFKAGKNKYGPRDLSHLKDTVDVQFVDDLDIPTNGGNGPVDWKAVDPTPATGDFDSIFDGDDEFWGARESLQHIYTAALSRMCAPWGVMANVAARVLTTVRPNTVLPDIIGGKGSLNWFAAVAARSGGGKGSASACAGDLVKAKVDIRNLGSGEGICQQFYKPGNKSVPPVEHEAIMFEATEIDAMTSLRERSGQTTMSVLRAGFSGETIGFSYRNNDHHIVAHEYRMCLVLSIQPGRARPLLEDADGGTPQRFQWFPGADARITADRPYWPGEIIVPGWKTWQYPRELSVPKVVEDTIVAERVKAMQGRHDALDGHALFVREKFAFALALIDNRDHMTEEDWELSGLAAEVSRRTREWVAHQLVNVEEEAAEGRGRAYGIQSAAADAAKAEVVTRRVWEASAWVMKRLEKAGPQTNRELSRSITKSLATWRRPALKKLSEDGFIRSNGDGKWELA